MQDSRLTSNGIQKLIGQMQNVIVQLSGVAFKNKGNQHFYGCQFSDGFSKIKGLVFQYDYDQSNPKLMNNTIIKILKSNPQKTNRHPSIVIFAEKYQIVHLSVKNMIGDPIPHDQYTKNGKNNPNGDNVILKEDLIMNEPKKQNKKLLVQQILDDTEEQVNNSNANSKPNIKVESKASVKPSIKQDSKPNTKPNAKVETKPNKPIVKQETKTNNKPIVKVDNKTNTKANISKGQKSVDHIDIRGLYEGINNPIILARVLFINPIKTIMTKKGTQTTILSFQIGDSTGTITCTAFKQTASNLQNILIEDNIYEICNGSVTSSSYQGRHQLKLTINENTNINLKQDDPNIPYIQDSALNIKALTQVPLNAQYTVLCLVKDSGQVQQFTSKAGKQCKRKRVYLLDPEQKIQVQATIWGQRAYEKFQKYPYVIKGVSTGQYNSVRQYTIKSSFVARPLKQHNFRKYIKDMDKLQVTNLNENSNKKQSGLSDFDELSKIVDSDEKVWTSTICYFQAIRNNAKNFYVSCPHCKKKVADQQNASCISCNKYYDKAKYRYILNANFVDSYNQIWATAYDQIGQKILDMPAQQFANLNEQETKQLIEKTQYKQFKMLFLTKNDQYNNEIRKKTSIVKVMDINYGQQAKNILSKLVQLYK